MTTRGLGSFHERDCDFQHTPFVDEWSDQGHLQRERERGMEGGEGERGRGREGVSSVREDGVGG